MTSEEREAFCVAFSAILASLRQIEVKIDAAEKVLEVFPEIHAKYKEEVDFERAKTQNALSTTHEYLRKTLGKNTQ